MTRVPSLALRVLIGWAIAAAILCAAFATNIAHLWFLDPDDAMRLSQVRDWLSGQSWWDVGQHRLWGGAFAMHWSRLVDLPIAATIALLRPLAGDAIATRAALTLVPLLTLLVVMALASTLTRRMAGDEPAGWAPLLVPLSVPVVFQMHPLRIDHHGWQVALALGAVAALLVPSRPSWRSGAAAGAALATLLTVSLEGLPITAAILAVVLLSTAAIRNDDRLAEARALLLTLLPGILVLHVATRGPLALQPACDAIAPGWIAAMGVGIGAALAALSLSRPVWRLVALGGAGIAALATLALVSPDCLRGPFETLDPFVYRHWYRNVAEGLPVWEQDSGWAAMMLAGPVLGLVGGAMAWRAAAGAARRRWAMLLAIAAAGLLLSLLVMRTAATANALALPGCAVALDAALRRARRATPGIFRLLATAGAILLASPGMVLLFAVSAAQGPPPARPTAGTRPPCTRGHELAALARLPRATLFAPIDVTPMLLAWTDHHAVGAGYHRNPAAIRQVMEGFMAPPDRARAIVLASHADYVVGCPGGNDTAYYRRTAPDGLWARLERGERIAWLRPVDTGTRALAWRVIPLRDQPLRP